VAATDEAPQLALEPFDGQRIETAEVGVSGTIKLNLANSDDAARYEALRTGRPVQVRGWVSNTNVRKGRRDAAATGRRWITVHTIEAIADAPDDEE
jgi:hypothetical protein